MCVSISEWDKSQNRILKVEEIRADDFDGATRREARKIEARAVSLSSAVRAYLKVRTRKLVRELTGEIKETGKVLRLRKAKRMSKEQKRLLKLLSYYGLRQITDSGKELAGSEWVVPNTYISDYLSQKEILIQQLDANLEKEFRGAVGRALADWMQETPRPTIGQISERLRSWLTVESQKGAPYKLKPLGNRFTVEGLGARARMIARTEINAARNYGRVEAGKLIGREYLIWIASDDGKSGRRQHNKMDGLIVRQGKFFKNPRTGARLRYPGDPGARSKFGVAGEVINCRCSARPISAQMAERLKGGINV